MGPDKISEILKRATINLDKSLSDLDIAAERIKKDEDGLYESYVKVQEVRSMADQLRRSIFSATSTVILEGK